MYTERPLPAGVSAEDVRAVRQDKYQDGPSVDLAADVARLAAGEPLAYVIGWLPFLGVTIHLDSRPLIPRSETEWWTEKLIESLRQKFGDRPFSVLDLCAGSGCIGLAVLKAFPQSRVSFGELVPEHCTLIEKNLEANQLDAARAVIRQSDLFAAFGDERFDTIATNPPYIPAGRALSDSVTKHEPREALFAGPEGLDLIRTITTAAPSHLTPGGSIWMECDIDNAEAAKNLLAEAGLSAALHTDQYGRARFVVAY